MGIAKFYAEYILKLPHGAKPKSIKNLARDLRGRAISTILIDANGMLHPIAQKIFAYSDDPKKVTSEQLEHVRNTPIKVLMEEYRIALHVALDILILRVRPSRRIIIGVDGVAPAAKISQQRSRRYGAKGLSDSNGRKFDSNALTPGTEFMDTVDIYMQEWCDKMISQGYEVHYSSHMDPGEGEHKIFWTAKELVSPDEVVAVEGLDGDLFMLSLTAKFTVILLRSCKFKGETFVNIDEFKRYITNLFEARYRKLSYDRCYEDFIILLYLIGNDFLPRLDMIGNVADTVDVIAASHLKLKRCISDGPGKIHYPTLQHLFSTLRGFEVQLLIDKSGEQYFYPHKILHDPAVRVLSRNPRKFMDVVRSKLFETVQQDRTIALEYLNGITWVFKYYTTQNMWSKLWIYSASKPPLIESMYEALIGYKPPLCISTGTKGFSVQQQLLSVIPPISVHLMDPYPGLADKILSGGELEDLSPVKSVMVIEGVRKEDDIHLGKRLLPLLDTQRILAATE